MNRINRRIMREWRECGFKRWSNGCFRLAELRILAGSESHKPHAKEFYSARLQAYRDKAMAYRLKRARIARLNARAARRVNRTSRIAGGRVAA